MRWRVYYPFRENRLAVSYRLLGDPPGEDLHRGQEQYRREEHQPHRGCPGGDPDEGDVGAKLRDRQGVHGDGVEEVRPVEEYLLVGRRVWHMDLSNDGSKLLTTNGVSGDVSVIDVDKMKVIKSIKVGRYPWGVKVLPE